MNARLPKYVPVFLVLALAVNACGADNAVSPAAPSKVGVQAAAFTAEPEAVDPEFFPSPFCRQFNPFGVSFVVIVRPQDDVFLRGMRLQFVDRFGSTATPQVVPFHGATPATTPGGAEPIPFPTPTIPTSPPIPTPAAQTLPIPGASGFDPLLIQRGSSQRLPFFLRFGCGVPADGTVFVDFDLSDRHGRRDTSHVRVRLRG